MRYFLLLPFYFCQVTFAGDLTIFDVRKPVAMSEKEVVQKDFYIDSGSEAGLQKDMIITVVRRVPLYDTYQSRSAGDLKVEVAKVRIIQVQRGLSVARFVSSIPRADIPILEEDYIMIGDRLDMSTATKDKRSAANDDGAPLVPVKPEKKPEPVGQIKPLAPAQPPPPPAPAEITSQKVEAMAPQDPGIKPTEGPAIQ